MKRKLEMNGWSSWTQANLGIRHGPILIKKVKKLSKYLVLSGMKDMI